MRAARKEPLLFRLIYVALFITAILAMAETAFGYVDWVHRLLEPVFTWLIPMPQIDWFTALAAWLFAVGLKRRKRMAWTATVLATATTLASYVLSVTVAGILISAGQLDEAATDLMEIWAVIGTNIAVLVAYLVALIACRRHYVVRSRRGNALRAVGVFLTGVLTISAVGALLLFLVRGVDPSYLVSVILDNKEPAWIATLMGLGWTASALAALWTAMRSQHELARTSIDEELRIRTLLASHPTDSLGYFATRRDKSVLLTEHSGVTYRSSTGVALASGDPLGDPSTWPGAADAFGRHASEYGLVPAAIGASEAGARAYVQAGLKAFPLGDEAILHTSTFRLADLPEVNRAVRHVKALGYTVRIRRHRAIGAQELAELTDLADQWRSGEEERGFSMALGRLGDPSDGQCVMVEALFPAGDERGQVAGLLSFVPWGADGLSLDVMRRHPEADNGVTELMVSSLMTEGSDVGITKVSLNFVVFRDAFERGAQLGANPFQRMWRRILLFASRWWQLESLYRSNQKYNPQWLRRYVCYTETGELPRVSFAMAVAEGFLTLPGRLGQDELPQPHRSQEASAQLLEASSQVTSMRSVRVPTEVSQRMVARERLLAAGTEPYPASVSVTASCQAVRQAAAGAGGADAAVPAGGEVTVAGRVMSVRNHGGVLFADLRDWTGDLQVLLAADLDAQALAAFRRTVRTGDQVAVTGAPGRSRNGTPSLLASGVGLTNKALRPLPSKRHGIKDPEARVRLRHLALITSPHQRRMITARSQAIQAVRTELLGRDYLEVETPMLHPIHGGANARPFRTHINAYDLDLYLRIAPELYLKKLMVGGMDRIFEIGRSFRNEGADATHNPEFTMLEAYQAYADYEVMKDVIRGSILAAAKAATGGTVVRGSVGGVEHEIDLAQPWRSVTITEAVSQGLGEEVTADTPVEALRAYADGLKMTYDPRWDWGAMLQELYEHLAEGVTVEPTFFCDFPASTSPLTRQHRADPRLAERWDLIIFGSEVGTAYSELVDPVIQRERLTAQSLAAANGDVEAMELDESFLAALEQGMPPSGGLGLGLDRLVMMLTDASIRETIAFPLVRPN